LKNLIEDFVRFRAGRRGFENVERDVDCHPAGDLAGAQSTNAIGDCGDRTANEPVVFTVGLPESDAVLVVMTNRPS
jgi:hypothetical protein